MLRPSDNWFLQQEEPAKSCLQFMREHILQFEPGITEAWKYRMPFFCLRGKMLFYLWIHKENQQPYLGIVDGNRIHHPDLLAEKRKRMKIFLIDPEKDIPLKKLNTILQSVLDLHR